MTDNRSSDQRQGYVGGIGSGQGGTPIEQATRIESAPRDSRSEFASEASTAKGAYFERYKQEYLAELDRRYSEWRRTQERLLEEDLAAFAADTAPKV
jgi:hypothetical protein